MDGLPHEIQRIILSHLDLNHLARCGRVSRSLEERVDEVLSTITCISCDKYQKMDFSYDIDNLVEHLSVAIRRSAPANTSYQAWLTNENMSSFMRFLTRKCPRVSSLIGSLFSVLIGDIAPLSDRIRFLILGEIITEPFYDKVQMIDAETLAVNFPNMQFYHFTRGYDLCPNEVTRAYAELRSTQLLQYEDHPSKIHRCQITVDVRSIDHLFSISVRSRLALHELRPSSLNSLQFLKLKRPPLDREDLPHLPNLVRATLECKENLNSMIRLLHNSPELSFVFLTGEINEESVPALNILTANCTALKFLIIYCYTLDDGFVDNPDRQLDLSHSKSLKKVVLKDGRDEDIINMAMRVIFPPDCDSILYTSDTICFRKGDRVYEFHDSVVSLDGIGAFAHPIELEIDAKFGKDSARKIIGLCPRISRLKWHLNYFASTEKLLPIFRSVLANSDVSDILIINAFSGIGHLKAEKFLGVIIKFQDRSFSVLISCVESRKKFESILRVSSRNYTICSEERPRGRLELYVKISAAVNVPSPLNAE